MLQPGRKTMASANPFLGCSEAAQGSIKIGGTWGIHGSVTVSANKEKQMVSMGAVRSDGD